MGWEVDRYGLGGRQVWGLESGSMEGRRAIGGEGERGEVEGGGSGGGGAGVGVHQTNQAPLRNIDWLKSCYFTPTQSNISPQYVEARLVHFSPRCHLSKGDKN